MIERLNADEQRVMLELLIHIARADGRVADIEQEILENYASLVEVDFASLSGTEEPAALIARLHGAASRAIVLQELLRLTHLDGILNEGERAAIFSIAEQMGFPDEVVHQLDAWVVDGLRWVLRGEELMETIESQFGAPATN